MGLTQNQVYDAGGARAVSKELRWCIPVVPRVSKWMTACKTTCRELSVPLLPSHGINNPKLIALELQNLGLHNTGREKTQLQTAIWNKSCLLLAPIPTPPNLMGLNHEEARLLPYYIFSNINERPSRDILFLIKLEEPYSCLWINAELWDTQGPSSGSAPCRPCGHGSYQLPGVLYFFFPLGMLERKDSHPNW